MRFVRHIGIDHAFPFPMSYMQRYGNETRDQFLDGFMRLGEVDRQIDLDVDPGLARKVRFRGNFFRWLPDFVQYSSIALPAWTTGRKTLLPHWHIKPQSAG